MSYPLEPATVGKRPPRKATPEEIASAGDPDAMIAVHIVAALIGLGPLTIRRMVKRGTFPEPHAWNRKTVRWRAGDVRDWLKTQAALKGPL